jgi:hypothetical protein
MFDCNTLLIVLIIILLIVIIILCCKKSTFGSINDILNNNYGSGGCTSENRQFPEGKVPGSYLGLSDSEKNNLLKKFVDNSSL